MVIDTPEISPNPSTPAIMASITNITAQINQLITPFLFIFSLVNFSSINIMQKTQKI
jgi:hypothetical protein